VTAIAILAAVILSGCATVADDLDFQTRTAAANATPSPDYPALIVRVDDPDYTCRGMGSRAVSGLRIVGCADYMGRANAGMCTVIVGHDAPAWVVHHERLHCVYGAYHQ
jgi:uncharacterized protein YceK